MRGATALALLVLAASRAAAAGEPRTINEFFAQGKPTFVAGTAGDADADRKIRAQIDLIRGMIFPDAKVLTDSEVLLGPDGQGSDAWPENPVLYGGPHVNLVLSERVKDRLPFKLERAKLVIGDRTFTGDEYRILCVVPGTPSFMLFAGTGYPGVAEINATSSGPTAFVVADRFGPVTAGSWERGEDGRFVPRFSGFGRRIEWRSVEATEGLRVLRPKVLPIRPEDEAVNEACARALARARKALGLTASAPVDIHVYPDRRSKQSLTGDPGDGRADILSRSVHVLPYDPREGGPFESPLAHELTHVLCYENWGPAITPLMGEGIAVWASGTYSGRTIEEWRKAPLAAKPDVRQLLGPGFRKLPERASYPLAGILTGLLVEMVGREKLRVHLYAATAGTWDGACRKAGTTAEEVQARYREALTAR